MLFSSVLMVAFLSCVAAISSNVQVLTDADFDQLTSQGSWLVEFYAPWYVCNGISVNGLVLYWSRPGMPRLAVYLLGVRTAETSRAFGMRWLVNSKAKSMLPRCSCNMSAVACAHYPLPSSSL